MLDDWNKYVDQFIQVVPIEYKKKKVLQEEQMQKIAAENCRYAEIIKTNHQKDY